MSLSKKFKRIWDIATTVIVAIVVIFALLLVGVRLFGIQVYSVISGSIIYDVNKHKTFQIVVKSVTCVVKLHTFIID